ncbi:hypothetical protein M5K25_001102 [Dendrobium thyrsiflorum]|uniref:BHLH domain-containing protein n=1 Tax=Dendrobium thyrsiflorum TaxID=117978 RepID=A0ABD0WFP4_DENTH
MLSFSEPEVDNWWPAATPQLPALSAAVGQRLTSAPAMADMMIGEWFPATDSSSSQSSTQTSSYSADSINDFASSGFISSWQEHDIASIESSPDPFLPPFTGERSSSMAADQHTTRNQNDANQSLRESENIEITVRNVKRKKTTHLRTEEELHCLLPSFESTSSTLKVRTARRKTQNIGVYVTVLQKLVSPFGKTDTASVLHEASIYIKAMQERIKLLSKTHLESSPYDLVDQGMKNGCDQRSESLRGMGLCLVPISPLITSIVNDEPSDDYMSLGSLFGRPLRKETFNGTRPSVACILVELDVTKRYPDQVWLGSETIGYIQCMEMEEFSSYCSHCKVLGHSKVECPILHPHLAVDVANDTVNVGISDEIPSKAFVGTIVLPVFVAKEVVPQVLNDFSHVNVRVDLPLLNSDVWNAVVLVLDQEACGNLIHISSDVDSPIIFGNKVGNLDPSSGVVLVVSGNVGACDNVVVHAKVAGECEVDRVICQDNLMVENELSTDLNLSVESPMDNVDPSPVGSKGSESLVDVPIDLISPNVLNDQLILRSGDTCLVQSDWLDESPRSHYGV